MYFMGGKSIHLLPVYRIPEVTVEAWSNLLLNADTAKLSERDHAQQNSPIAAK